jgi:hypothetical protein
MVIKPLQPRGYPVYNHIYFLPTWCVYVLKYSKYSDYFHIQHWLVFIAETKRVHYAVRTESLCMNSG